MRGSCVDCKRVESHYYRLAQVVSNVIVIIGQALGMLEHGNVQASCDMTHTNTSSRTMVQFYSLLASKPPCRPPPGCLEPGAMADGQLPGDGGGDGGGCGGPYL